MVPEERWAEIMPRREKYEGIVSRGSPFIMSGMPDTDAAIIRPLWGGVQRKARIASDGWDAHSETEERKRMDSDRYGSVFRHEPWSHLRHRTGKAGSWIDNASDYRPWPRNHDGPDIEKSVRKRK